jgi:O-antigen ligase
MDNIMDLRKIISYFLVASFFVVPLMIWLGNFKPFVAMKELIFGISIIFCFFLLISHFILEGKFSVPKSRLFLAVILYLVYIIISYFAFPYTDGYAVFLFSCHILLFIIIYYACDEHHRNAILYSLCAVALLSAIYGVFQFFGYDYQYFVNYFGSRTEIGIRTFTSFGNPNLLGGFCVFISPILAALCIDAYQKRKDLQCVSFGLVLVLNIISLLMSQTRGSWIAFMLTAAVFAVLYFKHNILVIIQKNISVVIVISLILVILGSGLFYLLKSNENFLNPTTVNIRKFYYTNTLDMIKEKPLFGRGFGTFNVYYPLYRDARVSYQTGEQEMEYRVEHPHNEHLEILSDLGILGYILFIWIVIEALLLLIRKNNILDLGIAVAIIGILIDGLMSQNLRFIVISSLLWLALGFSNSKQNKEHSAISFDFVKVLLVFAPPIAIIFGIIYQNAWLISLSSLLWVALMYFALENHSDKPKYSLNLISGILIIVLLILLYFPVKSVYVIMQSDSYVKDGTAYFVQSNQESWQKSIEFYDNAIEKYPSNKRALYYLAASYNNLGNKQKAIEYYNKLLSIDPNFIQANYQLAVIYIELNDIAKAKEYFVKQTKVNNMYWRAYYGVAFIDARTNEKKEGLEAVNEIYKINAITPLSEDDLKKIEEIREKLVS